MPFKVIASPVVNIENEVIGLLAIASQNFAVDFSNSDRNLLDVMSKKASKIAQSHFDPLTGLENSNSFELILKDLMKQSWGLDVQHAIANIDIDRMAVINDISGRDAGDLLIKKVGKTLAGMVRSRDVVARLGSDKFGVLLENCDLATARTVMKKIAHAVSAIDMEWEGESHEVSLSIAVGHQPSERGRNRAQRRQGTRPQLHPRARPRRFRPATAQGADSLGRAYPVGLARRQVHALCAVDSAAQEQQRQTALRNPGAHDG
jgi:diguanylate cyclase (GGDEF)-like protein